MKTLAIDLGEVRTGIAISDFNESLASPVCVIEEKNREKLLTKIIELIKEYNVSEVVVGLPKNMDGSEGESAKKAREFQRLLKDKTNLNVFMVDERGTTITAHKYLNFTDTRGKKRKKVVDSVAATIILQNYLDSKKSTVN